MADLQAISDRLEIEDLLTRYAWAIDSREFDALDGVFTPDAFVDYTTSGGIKGQYPEIKAWLAQVLAYFPAFQHYVMNKDIRIHGDTATSRCALYNPMGKPTKGDALSFFFIGAEYHDKLVHTPIGWRITERIEKMVWADGDVPSP